MTLRELYEAATGKTWRIDTKDPRPGHVTILSEKDEYVAFSEGYVGSVGRAKDTFALIVALHNCLPELLAVAEAAKLKRNTVIHDDPNFVGRWVAVPEEDFDALTTALLRLKEKEGKG